MLVKTGDATKRYLGTIRTVSTSETLDTVLKRYVWNAYNRVERRLYVTDTTASWNWNSAGWHQCNASTANSVKYVCGLLEDPVEALATCIASSDGVPDAATGVGIDVTNANSSQTCGSAPGHAVTVPHQSTAKYAGYPGLGWHELNWLEYNSSGVALLFWGTANNLKTGLTARVLG